MVHDGPARDSVASARERDKLLGHAVALQAGWRGPAPVARSWCAFLEEHASELSRYPDLLRLRAADVRTSCALQARRLAGRFSEPTLPPGVVPLPARMREGCGPAHRREVRIAGVLRAGPLVELHEVPQVVGRGASSGPRPRPTGSRSRCRA